MILPTRSILLTVVTLTSVVHAYNFWRLPCRNRLGVARMDPIMTPGRTCDHLHTIFGSGGFSENVTEDDLLKADCTSCAVTQDRSAYWTPPLMFRFPNGSTTMVNQDGGMLAYYFAYGEDPQPFPKGFRMIAGNTLLRNFSGPVPDPPTSDWTDADKTQFALSQKALGFNCLHYGTTNEGSLYRHTMPDKDFIDENCSDGLRLELMFPSCWNGVDVDSHDHKSHMAYPDLVKDGTCPEGFSNRLVSLFYETKYDTQNFRGMDGQFVLATGDPTGCGYHGDFIQGWEPEFLQQAMNECSNPSGEVSDCSLFTNNPGASTCQITIPDILADENPFFNFKGLVGDVPIQYGPEQATPPHVQIPTTKNLDFPGLGNRTAGSAIAPLINGLAIPTPSWTAPSYSQDVETTSNSIQLNPTDAAIGAGSCEEAVIHETIVVEIGEDGIPVTTFAPVHSATTTSATATMKRKRQHLPDDMKRAHHHRHSRYH